MKFIVRMTFVFFCATGFSRSKPVDKNEKKGKGTYLVRLRHKENQQVTSNERAEQKSVFVKIGKLFEKPAAKVTGAITFKKVPYTRGEMLYIQQKSEKRTFLKDYMKLPVPIITDGVLNMEVFTTKNLNVAILFDPQLRTASKVFKVFDPSMGLKMYQTPTTSFAVEKFKEHGVLQGFDKLYTNNAKGLQRGHLVGARLSTEDANAFSASYSFLNVAPMYKKFNGPIYFRQMESRFLSFVKEAAYAQEKVYFMVSVSPNCRMNDPKDLRLTKYFSNLDWLGNDQKGIVIPRSFGVIAYSVPKSSKDKFKVFAWVGNNDNDDFPKWYFPDDLKELIPYYKCNGDLSTLNGITELAKTGYTMWQGAGTSSALKN